MFLPQPVDPALGGRGGQAHPLAEPSETLPTVVDQQSKKFVIKVIKTPQNTLDSVRMSIVIASAAPYLASVTITMRGATAYATRRTRPRHYLMCPPTYFAVSYSINPWMDPNAPVDRWLALGQWTALVETYRAAGHCVEVLDPIPGLPDMVYAANGALVVDGRVLPARFAYAEREPEAAVHAAWHQQNGHLYGAEDIATPVAVNEGGG